MHGLRHVLFPIDTRAPPDGTVVTERTGRGFRPIFRTLDSFGASRTLKFSATWPGAVTWMKCLPPGEVSTERLFTGFPSMKTEAFDGGVTLKNNRAGRGLSLRLSSLVSGTEKFTVTPLLFVKAVRV